MQRGRAGIAGGFDSLISTGKELFGSKLRHGTRGYGGGAERGRPEYEYAYIHAGIALITLGCLAMVVSIVLSFFAATRASARWTTRRRGAEQEHPHVFACLIVMNVELFMSVVAGCMELLYRPLIQDEHRLHNMECAIAVFNIAITPCMRCHHGPHAHRAQGETRRGPRGQPQGRHRDRHCPKLLPGQPLLLQQQGQWESLLFAIQRVHVNGERVAYRVIESAGAIELFRNPPVAIPA
ncbi:hypothetical protein Q5P01_000049 [Channa striata]|uniref:Uncharacterized protein n=1 Tax=Channa striata TaxID=64152 RepID=A0AA88IJB0_CHASR|nr:hypothetical protein Q5P01_000049 [Channa striata]